MAKKTNKMARKKTHLQKYSVLLLYPDYLAEQYGEETFYSWVETKDNIMAVREAQKEAAKANPSYFQKTSPYKKEDFLPLLCIAGHHYGLSTGSPYLMKGSKKV